MRKLIFILIVFISCTAAAQTEVKKSVILYGQCTKDSLYSEPFGQWFKSGYNNYKPNIGTVTALKAQKLNNITIEIFFGSWCGDSKRELPGFLQVLNTISFPEKKLTIIGVGNSDSLTKQSPQHQETGKGIFRVPTFIVYKNGVEINRINEYPVLSLEKDLLQILTNQPYTPNYPSFALINNWLKDGTLQDSNISTRSLSGQLAAVVKNENELNSLGYLLLKQGKKENASKIFQLNYYLFPESANVISSLGEGYYENNDMRRAVFFLEKSLELNKDPKAVAGILSILYKAKEKKKS
ncbi:MAG: hypothetical protein WBP16_14635 [Ferruginibacter sp.]